MPLKIIRNDITTMKVDAIVNTAGSEPLPGRGCDIAIYRAAGMEKMLAARGQIGVMKPGEAALTEGFDLPAKYVIHTVSPYYTDGQSGEEELLRSCYRNSLAVAVEKGFSSVAFPLISAGSFGYPKEEAMRIAIDEITDILRNTQMTVYLVVFGEQETKLGSNLSVELESYIDSHYVAQKMQEEYCYCCGEEEPVSDDEDQPEESVVKSAKNRPEPPNNMVSSVPFHLEMSLGMGTAPRSAELLHPGASEVKKGVSPREVFRRIGDGLGAGKGGKKKTSEDAVNPQMAVESMPEGLSEEHRDTLDERMAHLSDTFSEYLLYLIESKGMTNAEVYKRAIVDKKVFSKIKNNPNAHPQKITAMCLCVGAMLNLDETKDLLARAGYALSPCDKTDIVFSFFIEAGIYDMIELDIQLEEHGLECLIL